MLIKMGNYLCTPHNAPYIQFITGLEGSELWLSVTRTEEPGLYQVSGLASNSYMRASHPSMLARYLLARTRNFPATAAITLHTNFGIQEPLNKDADAAIQQITQLLEFMGMIEEDGV